MFNYRMITKRYANSPIPPRDPSEWSEEEVEDFLSNGPKNEPERPFNLPQDIRLVPLEPEARKSVEGLSLTPEEKEQFRNIMSRVEKHINGQEIQKIDVELGLRERKN